MTHAYDDIIDLPHHTSPRRVRMSNLDRAAQFSPFAALTGYEAALQETARLTDKPAELDESRKAALNETLRFLLDRIDLTPRITVIHFQSDARKEGGAYVQTTGQLKKIDPIGRYLLFTDGRIIAIEQIYEILPQETPPPAVMSLS